MRRARLRLSTALVATVALATTCSQDSLTFEAIQLGRSLNADKTVSRPTTRFTPSDTIYVAVLTGGSGSGTVKARWLYAGRVISEPEQKIRYQGPAATEFRLQKSDGFPPGDYSVELFLDGVAVGSRQFRVETGNPKDLYTFPNTTPKR